MNDTSIRWEQGDDGIVVLTIDDPNQSANTMNDLYRRSMTAAVDRLEAEKESIAGVIVTSGKNSFFAGADLNELIRVEREQAAEVLAVVTTLKRDLRRLETLGRPVVAALNGTALGGGLEIALACHHRIAVDDPKTQFGLPEVTLGLLPGVGGVTRAVRMLGLYDALMNLLLQGQRLKPAQAKDAGIVDELVASPDELLDRARAWVASHPDAAQPWDRPDYRMPGGTPSSPKLASFLPAFPANLRKQTKGANFPAPHHILCAAVEGAQVDFETAQRIESRYFVDLVTGQVARNMMTAFWFNLNHINSGGSRPDGVPIWQARKVAVLGAGMMGAGIAYACARAGIDVVLKDVSPAAAEKGKGYSERVLDKAVSKGKLSQQQRDEALARITPTGDLADCAGADLVIEAVFEDTDLKHRVFGEIETVVAPDALLGSNTSTLPITGLATAVRKRENFIGLHFFSPVDKMPLLEIIRGAETSDETLARAFDLAQQIKKTPIVVNDSRGFFTSRVIGTRLNEGLGMLEEGLNPVSVERAAAEAGYPTGVLQICDELSLQLAHKIRSESRRAVEAAGGTWTPRPGESVVDRMLQLGRPGKAAGAGFYEYRDGKRVGLWRGMFEQFTVEGRQIPYEDMKERLLFAEALEAVRCVAEGVIRSVADANIGSIFGIGFPAWTGGVLQYVNQYDGGVAGFVARAEKLAAQYGERFRPPELLLRMAEAGDRFA
jgi:3-hydroxyacyl-CoA dehydrogenase / enoyl-CoA hydratase / 3-hydroxybutyryl-CoA epimerase